MRFAPAIVLASAALLVAAPAGLAHKVTAVSGLTDLDTGENTYRVELKMEVQPTGDPAVDDQITPEQAARTFAEETVVIYFDDEEQSPSLDTRIESMSDPDTPEELQRKAVYVGLTGAIPKTSETFMLYVRETTDVSVIMLVRKNGKPGRRFQVLYPGDFGRPVRLREEEGTVATETSETVPPAPPGFAPVFGLGFRSVFPEGTIHWVFAVAILLLTLETRPLLCQAAAFLAALALGLGSAAFQIVAMPLSVSAAVMGLGLLYVALETLSVNGLKPWRVPAVFVAGMFHGFALGSSPAFVAKLMAAENDFVPTAAWLLGATLSISAAILAGALLLKLLSRQEWYRRTFVNPLCLLLAGAGLYWACAPFL